MTTQFKKSKIVMLPTEKASQIQRKNNLICSTGLTQQDIYRIPKEGTLNYYSAPIKYEDNQYWKSQHLYFLSDEEIKAGDWAINIENKSVNYPFQFDFEFIENGYKNFIKKIIASTDPLLNLPRPSDSFIKKYCELGGIENVMVEYTGEYYYSNEIFPLTVKVAPDNTITIKAVKDSWNREEVIELMRKAWNASSEESGCLQPSYEGPDPIEFDEWIETNL